jgi:hypothetical protein
MKRATIIVFVGLLALMYACQSGTTPHYAIPPQPAEAILDAALLTETEVMSIVEKGIPAGKQYIITKVAEDAFVLEEVNAFPPPQTTSF